MSVKITVLAFATAGDLVGHDGVEIELDDGARLSDLRARLVAENDGLGEQWPRLAVAVDGTLVGRGDDPALDDGAEVALLPPVSGGSPAASSSGASRARLVDGPIDVGVVQATVAASDCGAVLLFLGTVRDHHDGRAVARLTYSAYRSMAETALRRIVDELEAEAGAGKERRCVAIVHRLGDVPVGEASVVIAAASPHRDSAYEASRTALERLKKEVPIWKRELYADGEAAWREEEPLAAR